MVPDWVAFAEIIRQVFLSFSPYYVIICFVLRHATNKISCLLLWIVLSVPFKTLFSVVLSVATGVGDCRWLISSREICMDVDPWMFSNNPPNSASVADVMTFLMILNSTCTGPFYGGISVIGVLLLYFGPRKQFPPGLLCASGSEM